MLSSPQRGRRGDEESVRRGHGIDHRRRALRARRGAGRRCVRRPRGRQPRRARGRQYIVKQLQPYRLTPAGDDGDYVQSFDDDWRNILRLQPGDDPQLQNEVIVVGAHYDHVGYGNRRNSYGPIGRIHNGADDNASGISVLLETIEAFAKSGLQTRRSILFAFWDGEERGLVGSRYWLAHPTLPIERVKLAITLDMVGRLRDGQLYVLGTRSGYGLRRLLSAARSRTIRCGSISPGSCTPTAITGRFSNAGFRSCCCTPACTRDYHRPSDDVEKINRDGHARSEPILAGRADQGGERGSAADVSRGGDARNGRACGARWSGRCRTASLANWPANEPPPRLGISWREDEAEPGSVFLTRVVDGTPAAAAGLAVHDRIYELNGQPFADAAAFQAAITVAARRGPARIHDAHRTPRPRANRDGEDGV